MLLVIAMILGSCDSVGPRKTTTARGADVEIDIDDSTSPGKGPQIDDGDIGAAGKDNADVQAVAVAAYEEHILPLTQDNCANCHSDAAANPISPFFASNDASKAYEAASAKLDADTPARSRLVQRLGADSHNCWSECADNAEEMQAAIGLWAEEYNEAKANAGEEERLLTSEKSLVTLSPIREQKIALIPAANFQNVAAPMVVGTDDVDGDNLTYVGTPANAGNNNNGTSTGRFTISFNAPVAGEYTVFGRIKAPANNANSLFISADGGTPLRWEVPVSANWEWRATQNRNNQPIRFNLTAGAHTFTIIHREANVRINTIGITDDPESFNPLEAETFFHTIEFDLQPLTGKSAKLLVDTVNFDAETNTIVLKNLRIETAETVYLREIRPLINGKWDQRAATYLNIDQEVFAPGATLSTAAPTLLGEKGFEIDQLSFEFAEIR